ncbi:MAG: VWA domain-containing protein [Anaerolineales bacterium]|nr:VWA domain-containing protein [Anaerolineales bacterium]
MSFIWPIMLLSLLLIPLFIWLYLRIQQRRRRLTANFGMLGLLQESAGRQLGQRRHIPPALFLAGLTILLLAIARPETIVNLPRIEGTVILGFDVSGSMAADDLKPTRMEAAKAAARQFIEQQPNTIQIGIVAFSDGGFVVQTPTNDPDALLSTINRLTPQRGTSVGQGIFAALKTIFPADAESDPPAADNLTPTPLPSPTPLPAGTYTPAIIVLLTDGENNTDPDPIAAAQAAADRGVRIYPIGVGSTAGTLIQAEGFTIQTQLDEGLLQRIARITGGVYYNAQNEEELQAIYENITPQLVVKPEKMEVTSIFAGLGILVLLIGGTSSLLWFSRVP